MAIKLNQIIAVTNGKKTQSEKNLTEIYHRLQKPELFNGLSRRYTPLDEDGETLPSEEKVPQYNVKDAIASAKSTLTELINVVATQDVANTQAKADIVVDDTVVLQNVPVTHLLFLEKQLVDIQTFVSKLPTLDPSERWTYDNNVDCFVASPTKSNRNIKKFRNHVKVEATDKHPAQVDVYTEDVKVGSWETTKFSTCVDAKRKNELLSKVKQLIEAVKFAREAANSMEVSKVNYADNILNFVFE